MSGGAATTVKAIRVPRLGFLGVGWIGRQRMQALHDDGGIQAVALADVDAAARDAAAREIPGVQALQSLDELLEVGLDGLVIATPSAQHAEQAVAALERGIAVFCQKPLGRTAHEAQRVVEAARGADRPLAVDLSYRTLRATGAARQAIADGEIGEPFAAELVFHNGYGPDKPWFSSRRMAGGGCLMDLGTHLVDLGLWVTDSRRVTVEWAHLLRRGRPLREGGDDAVEDFALAELCTAAAMSVRLACSWYLPVGRDCAFECTVYGTEGAVSIRNVGGSFYDFIAHRHSGTRSEVLAQPPDAWGPRALADWAQALAAGGGFDPGTGEQLVERAAILDEIYRVAA
ncbi:MAG: Gfo/Idh/MocA family protein [Solirubrobacteraceae bacterium]